MYVVATIVNGYTYYVCDSYFTSSFSRAGQMSLKDAQMVVKYLGYGSILRAE